MHDGKRCPDHVKETIQRYVQNRLQPGSFLTAVLSNNLKDAVFLADKECYQHLGDILSYIYWDIPSVCWGSPEKVRGWLNNERESVNDDAGFSDA